MFDKAWFSGSSYSKSLCGCYFLYLQGILKTSSSKNQLAAIGGVCVQSVHYFATLTYICKHHVRGIGRVLSLPIML